MCSIKKRLNVENSSRGQVSTEFVITVAFSLLMIIPLSVLLFEHGSKTYDDISMNQGGLIARKITDSANSVYYLGHPSSVTLKVYMPEGIENINITGRNIIILLQSDKSIVSTANVNLTGSLKRDPGLRFIKITALENKVNITDDIR
ncbi:hypothetical protein GOV09_06220 [Candidatus Woesearchaeota archaeon]|nr:hypothetical protein [Candidatus Woesearchaeota archaeon]